MLSLTCFQHSTPSHTLNCSYPLIKISCVKISARSGSHTHSLFSVPNQKIVLYNKSFFTVTLCKMLTEKLKTDGLKVLCDHLSYIAALRLTTRSGIRNRLKKNFALEPGGFWVAITCQKQAEPKLFLPLWI